MVEARLAAVNAHFNPKQVKRSQLLRLVGMIQERNYGIHNPYAADGN